MEKIKFQLEDGTEAEFYVEEQTRIGGVAYLLVSDSLDDVRKIGHCEVQYRDFGGSLFLPHKSEYPVSLWS